MRSVIQRKADTAPTQSRIDWGLAALILGAVALIVVGLIVIPLAANRPPTFAPTTTPEGVVQRFYDAAYRGDYSAAYAFLSTDTQDLVSLPDLQQQMSYSLQQSRIHVNTATVHDSSATVWVTLTLWLKRMEHGTRGVACA
jgi:hypothetical protein